MIQSSAKTKTILSKTKFPSLQILPKKWFSTIPQQPQSPLQQNIHLFFTSRHNQNYSTAEYALVSSLKSSTSLSNASQLHSLILKTGLNSNIFIQNSLINLYFKCGRNENGRLLFDDSSLNLDIASWNIMISGYVNLGRVGDARKLFDEMPKRDCVSYTTLILGLAKNDDLVEAMEVFKGMKFSGVEPNEVTIGNLIAIYSRLGGKHNGRMLHTVAVKSGLGMFVLVSTNLINMYCKDLRLDDAKVIFDGMRERNDVTWNVMLNGYLMVGFVDSARCLFDRIPVKDLVSWSTMIGGYIRADRLDEALGMYRQMVYVGMVPNDVLIVDLLSACGRTVAYNEGCELHCMIVKTGLECYGYMQATIIYFYSACSKMDMACLQFEVGCKDNMSSWNALIGGFVRNQMVDFARQVFDEMPERDVVSWSSLISGYSRSGKSDTTMELFREMLASGVRPNEITMVSILSSISNSGNLHQGRWVHDYIRNNSIPLEDNLSAALIDMYAKCGSIHSAEELFNVVHERIFSISPWNAIICGLAIHGHADMSLKKFSDLQKTDIKPNSITFIGVLTACCHTGFLEQGEWYFDCMKRVYRIEPNIKHYGCMVDLLGKYGRLEEAERLIMSMPMKADVVIWGTLLAASRTHGYVEIGEKAARHISQLEPDHGAGRVLLSNIYADAGRWNDVIFTRKMMQNQRVEKLPGRSDVV